MNPDLRGGLFEMASVQRLVGALTDDLAQGRSLFLILPKGQECDATRAALGWELRRRDCEVRVVYADEVSTGRPLVSSVADNLGVRWGEQGTQRTVENLLRCEGMPEITICVGFERISNEQVSAWLNLLARWAEEAQDLERPPALCMIALGPDVIDRIPATNVRLAVRWWWGVPSLLELRLLCRNEMAESPDMGGGDSWREHMLPALSGGDISLASDLWVPVCVSETKIHESLSAHAERRGWSADVLHTWGAYDFVKSHQARASEGQRPAKGFERLWAEGAIHHTREHGLELQTAALHILGQVEGVRHRLWRGQASLLLPMIDDIRLRLCSRLTEVYGRGWSWRWEPPAKEKEYLAVKESDYGCELGHLAYLLRARRELRSYDGVIPLATQARDLRNELAHYRPVSFARFEEFWKELHAAEAHPLA